MKIILLKDVPKLGHRHDVKEVNSGHALNFLIPKGLAVSATPDMLKRVEADRAKSEGERRVQEDLLLKNIQDLADVRIAISGKANEKGHLFAAIHVAEIVAELDKQAHIRINPSFIVLEHPIKEVGEHAIELKAPVSAEAVTTAKTGKSDKAGKPVKFTVVVEAVK